MAHGYSLFDQVFSAQPPLLFVSLAAGMRATSDSIQGARPVEIAFGLLALAASGAVAYLIAGRLAAVFSTGLLAISPGFLVYSHAVEAEIPMMALVTASLAFALMACRRKSGLWPVLSGLALAAAVLMKLFAVEAVLPVLWILYSGNPSPKWSRRLRPALSFLVAAAVPVAVEFALISPSEQWQQVVTLHSRAASAHLPDLTPPLQVLWRFLELDPGLSVLAGIGILLVGFLGPRRDLIFLLLWLPGEMAMLILFRPLFPHHPAILLTGLAVAAGSGFGCLTSREPSGRWPLFAAGAAMLVYLAFLPGLVHADRHLLINESPGNEQLLASWVKANSRPSDLIAVDDLRVADMANRLVVPPLCDPSNVRLRSGYLTSRQAIDATRRYRPALVLPSAGIYLQVSGYIPWLGQHYRRVVGPGGTPAFRRK